MYEYIIVKGMNEARIEEKVNQAAADGYEVVAYAIRPSSLLGFFISGDHFAMMRRRKA